MTGCFQSQNFASTIGKFIEIQAVKTIAGVFHTFLPKASEFNKYILAGLLARPVSVVFPFAVFDQLIMQKVTLGSETLVFESYIRQLILNGLTAAGTAPEFLTWNTLYSDQITGFPFHSVVAETKILSGQRYQNMVRCIIQR